MGIFKFLAPILLAAAASAINIGDRIAPNLELHHNFPPDKINLSERVAGKSVIVVGLPGYLEAQNALKELGVDEVIIYCVNDGAVMKAWAEDQGIENSMITFMGDPHGTVTKAFGMEMTHPGPASVGIIRRCKRFAIYMVDGVVKFVGISEAENDPAGDDFPDETCAPALMDAIKMLEEGAVHREL